MHRKTARVALWVRARSHEVRARYRRRVRAPVAPSWEAPFDYGTVSPFDFFYRFFFFTFTHDIYFVFSFGSLSFCTAHTRCYIFEKIDAVRIFWEEKNHLRQGMRHKVQRLPSYLLPN